MSDLRSIIQGVLNDHDADMTDGLLTDIVEAVEAWAGDDQTVSGLLDGLPTITAPVAIKDERGEHHAVTNAITWVKRDDVREALRSDETRAQVIAAIPHADWCCTKGCVQPNGAHYIGDPNAVPMPDTPPLDRLPSWEPCPGDCTCEVGMIVPQALAALAGDDQ